MIKNLEELFPANGLTITARAEIEKILQDFKNFEQDLQPFKETPDGHDPNLPILRSLLYSFYATYSRTLKLLGNFEPELPEETDSLVFIIFELLIFGRGLLNNQIFSKMLKTAESCKLIEDDQARNFESLLIFNPFSLTEEKSETNKIGKSIEPILLSIKSQLKNLETNLAQALSQNKRLIQSNSFKFHKIKTLKILKRLIVTLVAAIFLVNILSFVHIGVATVLIFGLLILKGDWPGVIFNVPIFLCVIIILFLGIFTNNLSWQFFFSGIGVCSALVFGVELLNQIRFTIANFSTMLLDGNFIATHASI